MDTHEHISDLLRAEFHCERWKADRVTTEIYSYILDNYIPNTKKGR